MSGVLPLLAAYPASLPPLLVVGPRSLRDWLAEAAAPLGLAGRYAFVHCAELNQPGGWPGGWVVWLRWVVLLRRVSTTATAWVAGLRAG